MPVYQALKLLCTLQQSLPDHEAFLTCFKKGHAGCHSLPRNAKNRGLSLKIARLATDCHPKTTYVNKAGPVNARVKALPRAKFSEHWW